MSNTMSNNILNNLINFQNIFSYNRKIDKSIIFLKKTEFDIFYSCKYKYPTLVKETITPETGNPGLNENRIDRSKIEDPFAEDVLIPTQFRHTIDEYNKLLGYGVSMGHNAPAGQHKTNMKVFSETFLLSNITPQEMVLNSGLWALIENWCKKLGENKNLYNIKVFTGSINSKTNTNIDIEGININMNIPHKMFKIVCLYHKYKPNITFMEIFIVNNKPYYINSKNNNFDLSPFLLPVKSWDWFQKISGISINNLLNFYDIKILKIKPFRNFIPTEIHLYRSLQLLMKKSNWYGYLIYSKNINELENIWKECKLHEKDFGDLKYHSIFYESVKDKFIRESNNKMKKHIILFTSTNNLLNSSSSYKIKSYTKKYTKKYSRINFRNNKNNKNYSKTYSRKIKK